MKLAKREENFKTPTPGSWPWEDLVVAVLEVSVLLLPDRVDKLVLVEVQDLVKRCQVWA